MKGPVVARGGICTTSEVGVARSTRHATLPRKTCWARGLVPKPVPVIVTWVPGGPIAGANDEICTGAPSSRSKGAIASPEPATRTTKRPVCAPVGTITTRSVGVAVRTSTGRPPSVTRFSVMRGEKLWPTIRTS